MRKMYAVKLQYFFMEKEQLDQNKKIIFFLYFIDNLFIGLFFFFIKAVKHRQLYDASKTHHRIFHHSNKIVDEDPIEIVSQFRGDSMKRGMAVGTFNLRGQVKSLFGKINGSLHGASKATPAVDKKRYIMLERMTDGFTRLNHQGEVIWRTYFAKN